MNKDPYSVLGVSRDATEEQIKAAYRELARKYHPDNYSDNPLSDLAEDKMSEINEAYDAIMQERRAGKSASGTGTGGASYRGSTQYADVRSLINSNRIEEALELLDGVPPASRNAEWYFLNGSVLYRRGWFEDAYTSFSTACRMDPSNPEYREAFVRINKQRQGYGYKTANTSAGGCSVCDMCSGLICADCCCECMGGDLIRCC